MKATRKRMRKTTTTGLALITAGLTSLLFGCAGSADDLCAMAAEHLEACTGTSAAVTSTCDERAATRLLGADCGKLADLAGRSTFAFEWGDWGAPNHAGSCFCDAVCEMKNDCCGFCPTGSKEGKCSCDKVCASLGDCCPWCPQAPYGGGQEPGGKCYCDSQCHQKNDCCPGCGGGEPDGQCYCDSLCHQKKDCCPGCGGEDGGYLYEGGGGSCAYQNGNNWRPCNECGWQFCLPNGTWAQCQRPPDPNKFPCGGGATCHNDGFCSW